jgi:hypothetical protein
MSNVAIFLGHQEAVLLANTATTAVARDCNASIPSILIGDGGWAWVGVGDVW